MGRPRYGRPFSFKKMSKVQYPKSVLRQENVQRPRSKAQRLPTTIELSLGRLHQSKIVTTLNFIRRNDCASQTEDY